jgi:upstream activation factor subunit UAF30
MPKSATNKTKNKAQELQPTDEELKSKIKTLIPKVNLQNTGVKAFIGLLSEECGGINLKKRTNFIKEALSEAINELDGDDEDGSGDDEEGLDGEGTTKKKKPSKKGGGEGGGSSERGLSVKKEVSPELAKFLGYAPGEKLARTEIVKQLWAYIRDNQLQNPDNRREIFLDAKMKKVFKVDTFTMFTLNKYIGAHVHPFKPVDLTTRAPSASSKKRKASSAPGGGDAKKKRKPKKPGLQPPYRLSEELADVVGTDVLPRPQVVSAIWDYIKSNNLQVRRTGVVFCDTRTKDGSTTTIR